MADVVIENPVISSAFHEPARQSKFSHEGISVEVEARRRSACLIPIAQPDKPGGQKPFDTEWTQDRIRDDGLINDVRARVGAWRRANDPAPTRAARGLLEQWASQESGNPEDKSRSHPWAPRESPMSA